MNRFNERFRELKEDANLTAKELAEKLEIPASTLSYYLKDREPNYDMLIKISTIFDVSIDWLLGKTYCKRNETADILTIIEEINKPGSKKLTGESLDLYMKIQEYLSVLMTQIYTIYSVGQKQLDFLNQFHEAMTDVILFIMRYLCEFDCFMGAENCRKEISRENIIEFMKNTQSLSEIEQAVMLYPVLTYANWLSQVHDFPKEDYDFIQSLIDIYFDQAERKYPSGYIQNLYDSIYNENKSDTSK